jgi:hydrogenase expression/formation protein HypE
MTSISEGFTCPSISAASGERIALTHGEGGRLMRRLIHERVLPILGSTAPAMDADAAVLPKLDADPAFTTDSFVVSPLFFPGGDIGKLCVFGTVNDLAVVGARPLWISLSLIIEEGLPLGDLDRVLASVAAAAGETNVTVVTGDTKVVPRGAADGLFINTAGIGEIVPPRLPGPSQLQPGMHLIVSGPIACHGMAVMAARENLDVRPTPMSDCASLIPAVEALRRASIPVVAMRDATRGGVSAVLHEWAAASACSMALDESQVPVLPEVRGMCELLGLDPLHVANEGTMVIAVPAGLEAQTLAALQTASHSRAAAIIGHVRKREVSPVVVERGLGRYMPLDEPLGAPLPRIC